MNKKTDNKQADNKKTENKQVDFDFTKIFVVLNGGKDYSSLWEDVFKQKTEVFEDHDKTTQIIIKQPKKIDNTIILKTKK